MRRTPPQALDVVVDTGSPDLWVLSHCSEAAECAGVPLFAGASAARSGQPFSAQYALGTAAGELVADAVRLPASETLSFGLVNRTTEWSAANTTLSGLLGLGWAYDETDDDPAWLAASAGWEQPLFGVHLGRGEHGGSLTLGGVDAAVVAADSINYLPLVAAHDWAVALDGVVVNGQDIAPSRSWNAAVDTGTSHILAPRAAFDAVYAAVPGAFLHGTVPLFPCHTPPEVTLTLGGHAYPVPAGDLVLAAYTPAELRALGVDPPPGVAQWCEGALRLQHDGGDADDWILGDAFLKSVYTVFRATPPSVGFARLQPAHAASFGLGGRWPRLAATHHAAMLALVGVLALLVLAARFARRERARARAHHFTHKHLP
ncbi:hypothetical protein Q8F55_003433 [Vanrija albida]|uniref:Peptidase A1 domain-containing protein n=1 Tax=Vanrija albida TaxID=181172 RepID=A0ABR3Q3Z2_9TREE